GIASFKCRRRRRCHWLNIDHCIHAAPTNVASASRLRNLWRLELRWVTELAHNLDHRALPALGRHTGRRDQIDALLLVHSANDKLKLRICENTAQPENSRRDAGRTRSRK